MRPKGLNLRLLLVLPYMLLIATGSDVFCGNLTVFKQKWFSKDAQTLAAQKANDLKQCLDACCAIQVCNALTFMGFLGNSSSVPAANCVLFQCSDNCVAVDEHEAAEGVISVQIKRKPEVISQKDEPNDPTTTQDTTVAFTTSIVEDTTTEETTIASTVQTTEDTTTILSLDAISSQDTTMLPSEDSNTLGSDGQQSNRSFNGTVNSTNGKAYSVTVPSTRRSYTTTTIVTSTTFTQSFMTKAAIAPVWSVGLGLVLLVVCVGLNITAVTLYLCYRRKNVRRRDPPVNTIKTSTLHAFPPQQHHGPVMHSTMA